jgi:hypothetical protein
MAIPVSHVPPGDEAPITELRGLGPAMAEAMARAGICDVGTLRALGPDESYARMLRAGSTPHFIAFYCIEMALQGRPWNDCRGEEKRALRVRFDRVKAQAHDPHRTRFETMVDALGVVDR